MQRTSNKSFGGLIVGFSLGVFIVGLVMVNQWLQQEAGQIVDHPIKMSAIEPLPPPSPEKKESTVKKIRTGEVVRKTRLAPQRTFEISIFYQGGEEIARQKVAKGMAYDTEGEIPDGKVKFINESNETYGAEYYRAGELHGPAKIYYKDGRVKQELEYQYGRLSKNKEYYSDGILRMEEDYTDARDYHDGREVGIGKVYFRDGTLRYEWFMVNSEPTGFNRSYDRQGRLVFETVFDEYGQKVKAQAVAVQESVVVPSSLQEGIPSKVNPTTTSEVAGGDLQVMN